MAGMFGSCCEEQEAREAEFRSKIRAATAINENRFMRAHKVREGIARSLRCGDACWAGCGECDDDEEEPTPEALPPPKRAVNRDDDTGSDDYDEETPQSNMPLRGGGRRGGRSQSRVVDL